MSLVEQLWPHCWPQAFVFQEVDVKGCVQGAPALYKASAVLCHVKSDSAGTFVFKSIPVGDYVIVSAVLYFTSSWIYIG